MWDWRAGYGWVERPADDEPGQQADTEERQEGDAA